MEPRSKRASDRLLDGCVAAFAWWTVCCNLTILTEGTGRQLLITAAASGLVLGACAATAMVRRRRATAQRERAQRLPVAPAVSEVESWAATDGPSSFRTAWRNPRLWLAAATVGVIAAWPDSVSNWVLWAVPASLVLGFAVFSWREPLTGPSALEDEPRWQRAALWVLALSGGLITACLHLPNTDDVLYVNMAVGLADDPSRVLFSEDTLHGAGVIPHKAYHLHSFELLAGALSIATGIPPLEIMHLGLAVLAGTLTPLAWSRLFRWLDPQRALWMVAIVMLWYVLEGTTPFSVSMHAFARLFQGKAVLATAGVAAIAAYGIDFGRRPTLSRLAWLAAAQIAGFGLSATGIWLCPLVAVTAVAAVQPPQLQALGRVALACLSSGYVLAMGIWVLLQLGVGSGSGAADEPDAANETITQAVASSAALFDVDGGFERIRKAFTLTFFTFDRGMVYGAFLILAWPLARTALARRYIAAFMVVGLFFLCSPWLAALIAKKVTGYSTYPRVTWFLPFGAAIAICFAAPITIGRGLPYRAGSIAISAALLAAFFAIAPKDTVLDAAHFGWPPRLKVERPAYDVALRLRDVLPAKSVVVAPREITLSLPLLQRAPFPIMTKERFFVDDRDASRRFALRRRVERDDPLGKRERKRLKKRLDQYEVRAVVLSPRAARVKGMSLTLTGAGFHLAEVLDPYQLWLRDDRSTDSR